MKRYISLALAAVVLICSLAVPAYAADFDNVSYINLLDFYTYDRFNLYTGRNEVTFDLPTGNLYYSLDVVITSYAEIESVYFKRGSVLFPLSLDHISGDLYRIYGSFERMNDTVTLVFDVPSNGYICIQSFFVNFLPLQYFDAAIEGVGSCGPDTDIDISLNWGDNRPTSQQFTAHFDYSAWNLTLSSKDWKMYDYLDILLYLHVSDLNSISATFDGISVPFSSSLIPSSNGLSPTYLLSLRVDLRGLDKTSTADFELLLTGTALLDSSINVISLFDCIGYVAVDTIKPLPYFFGNLFSILSTGFSNVGTWISNQTSTITDLFSNWFNYVALWIREQTSTISSRFNYVAEWIREQTSSLSSTISTWGQSIVDAIIGDSSQIEQNNTISDSMQQQEQVNQEINVQLDSAVQDWNNNFDSVSGGFNTGFTQGTPALIWLSDKAQAVFNNMGWFGNMFFFLGFLDVFFLLMSKSGLGQIFKQKNGDD